MGKRKIDKSKKIEDKNQRGVAFCKRKRGFLKKAIELSRLCDQKIFMVMYDSDKDRVIQYSSDTTFQLKGAYDVVKRMKGTDGSNFESYTNDDYNKFELVDFRTLRYQKKDNQGDDEVISEFGEDANQMNLGHPYKTQKLESDILKLDTPISVSELIADQDLSNPKMKKVPKASSMENLCDPRMIQEF